MTPAVSNQSLTLSAARLYLASRARVRTPLGAAEYVECTRHHALATYEKRLNIALECLSIYRIAFPDQYARSSAPAFSMQREQEFYALVHTQCFPLYVDEETDLLTYLAREPRFFLPFIPMHGLQRHEWANERYNFDEVEIPCQLALLLGGMLPDNDRKTKIAGSLWFPEDFPRPAPPLAGMGWSLFVHACKTEDGPLRFMPLAFNLVTYKTGNKWLDLPHQAGYAVQAWSAEAIAALTIMRNEADKYDIAMRQLHNWFIEDLRARVARVVKLWNDASQKEADMGFAGLTGLDFLEAGVEAGWAPAGADLNGPMMAIPAGELDRIWNGRQLN